MDSSELRTKFLSFFEKNGHKIVPSSSLLPADSSVLFTTAGMQQFKPYYLGETSPYGNNVASCQKCVRTSDIEEVGDERHLTFFEMLGNFSFGGYFKEEAIKLAHEFVVKELKLEIDYVTIFSPEKVVDDDWRKGVPEDKESFEIWKKLGIPEEKIRKEGVDNFWGPTGDEGPCGPTTEIYVNGIEIWNIVFNEFFCDKTKKLEKLNQAGVDTGMGLERLAMVTQKVPTVFETDLFEPLIKKIGELSGKKYSDNQKDFRVIADHVKTLSFLIAEGVEPYKKASGSVLTRLIKKSIETGWIIGLNEEDINSLVPLIKDIYKDIYFEDKEADRIVEVAKPEEDKMLMRIVTGASDTTTAMSEQNYDPYNWYSTSGVPYRIIEEEWYKKHRNLKEFKQKFEEGRKKHQELSRTASAGMFKGGLADNSEQTTKLHTAAHLMLAGLRKVLGDGVFQKGSNITAERLRFDFSHKEKMSSGQIKDVENFVNGIIEKDLPVFVEEMPLEKAKEINAMGVFESKYGENVKVYFIGKDDENVSKEICGGPHVERTGILGKFHIQKEESSSAGVRRIKAVLE